MQLIDLFLASMLLALQAVGGVMSILPGLEALNWMPKETLAQLVVIGQASPGPNMLLIPLIGWQMAGVSGALVAAVGFCLPSAVAVLMLFSIWSRIKKAYWKPGVQAVLGAIGAAAVLLSTWSFFRLAGIGLYGVMMVLIFALLSQKTKIPPVLLIVAGGLIGALASLV